MRVEFILNWFMPHNRLINSNLKVNFLPEISI
jgi:hypothetical protein